MNQKKAPQTTKKRRPNKRFGERYWRNPINPTPEALSEFCRDWKLSKMAAAKFESFLAELVRETVEKLAKIRENKTIRGARSDLAKVLKALEAANLHISRMRGTSSAIFDLSPKPSVFSFVTAIPLSELYDVGFLSRVTGNSPMGFREDPDAAASRRRWAHKVIEHDTVAVLQATLSHLQKVLSGTEELIRTNSTGGRPPYDVAHFILLNACVAFSRFDPKQRGPTANPDGPFGQFAYSFVALLGLSTEWVPRQLPTAVLEWTRSNVRTRYPSDTPATSRDERPRKRSTKSTVSRTSLSD